MFTKRVFSPSKFRAARENAGYSRRDVAWIIKGSQLTIGAIERGERVPSTPMLGVLAGVLGCDINQLFDSVEVDHVA